jgi:copper transport protein
MTRRLTALVAVWATLLAGPVLVGPATPVARGHSQLVTSVPAAGEVVATSPAELRLVFSEQIDGAYTSLDLVGPDGSTIAADVGAPDPVDPYTLLAPLGPLPDGLYTVIWRALSAADGHTTSGFFTFGVGDIDPPAQGGASTGGGSIHAGHDETSAFLETESRIVGDLGLLLAVGLPLVAWFVLRAPSSTGIGKVVAGALGLAAAGAAGLLVLGASDVDSNVVSYATGSRTGQLLLGRVVVGALAGVVIWWLAPRRPRFALGLGAVAGVVGVVLLAAGSHSAGFGAIAPIVAIFVHVVAVAIWVSGVLVIGWLVIAGGPPDRALSTVVPRFSALALVSVGLFGLTGIYADWIHTRTLISLDTPYGTTLFVKIMLVLGALALGGLNYLSGARAADRRFRPRVTVEAGLALAVVVATGVLASGSPPAGDLPVRIATALSSAHQGDTAPVLEVAPGRPGPTRFVVTVEGSSPEVVELRLQRLDQPGETRLDLSPVDGLDGRFEASGGLLPAASRWDASVVLRDAEGTERARTRYSFALDDRGVSEGRSTPAIDPTLIVAVILLVAAALGFAYAIGGGVLPRVDAAASRVAVIVGSSVGAVLGVTILLGGPRL